MTDASSRPNKLRRRWFQFSLRTLLIAVTLVAGLLVPWRVYVEPYHQQRETMKLIEELGGEYTLGPADKWLRWVYGDDFQNLVLVDLADCDDPSSFLEQVAALPCLANLVVGGRSFSDKHLSRLKRLTTLNGLVLDSTSVTDDGIKKLKRKLPALAIYKSQRRTIVAIQQMGGGVTTEFSRVFPKLQRLVDNKYFRHAIQVDLSHTPTRMINTILAQAKGITTLRTLSFQYVKTADSHLAHLEGFTNVQELSLFGSHVSAGLAHLKGLTNLQKLGLTASSVSDADLAHLKGLKNLRYLSLDVTGVSDAGLAHLKSLTNLQSVYLGNSRVSYAGAKELQNLLPNCNVRFPAYTPIKEHPF